MARFGPLVWWWSQADPGFSEAFNGFVWEVSSSRNRSPEIVGNVSLNRAPGNRQRWIVCNVVVHDAYRGLGIGRLLTEEALEEAQHLGAAGTVLQVYENNAAALHLYTDLGFRRVGGETELRVAQSQPASNIATSSYSVRRWRPADGQATYRLAGRAVPQELQWLRPLRSERYRLSRIDLLLERIAGIFTGVQRYRLAALDGSRLVGWLLINAAFRSGEHQLKLMVDPSHRGQVEEALIATALHALAAGPPKPIRALVDADHQAALETLVDLGFQKQRTLMTLRKDF
jgi:ribosomal protein S18 acetylase RimI-like enzyme